MTLDAFSYKIVEILPFMLRALAKSEDNALKRGTISFPQLVALHYLSHKPKVTMTELAKVLSTKTSSTTVLVDRLIRDKMFDRSRDSKDRRLVWVKITAKGRKVLNHIIEQKRLGLKAIYSCLSEAERQTYIKILDKVYAFLHEKNTEVSHAR